MFAASLGMMGRGDWLHILGGAGVTMRTGLGLRAGGEVAWPSMRRADLVRGFRLGLAKPEAMDRELAGSPGAVTTVDVLGGIDWLLGDRVRLRGLVGGALVKGPDDIEPWADDRDVSPAADLAVAVRIVPRAAWWVAAGTGLLHYSGMERNGLIAGSPGTVVRPYVEVRRAF